MLTLKRMPGETLVIGDPMKPLGKIKVVEVKGNRVRIGLEFPKDVPIHRQEVADSIVAKGKEGAGDE